MGISWQKQKQRMEDDPEYAAHVLSVRRKSREKNKAKRNAYQKEWVSKNPEQNKKNQEKAQKQFRESHSKPRIIAARKRKVAAKELRLQKEETLRLASAALRDAMIQETNEWAAKARAKEDAEREDRLLRYLEIPHLFEYYRKTFISLDDIATRNLYGKFYSNHTTPLDVLIQKEEILGLFNNKKNDIFPENGFCLAEYYHFQYNYFHLAERSQLFTPFNPISAPVPTNPEPFPN